MRCRFEPGRPTSEGHTDWERVDAMTDEEVTAAALSDADAQPLDEKMLARMRPISTARAAEIKRRLLANPRKTS